MAKWRPRIREQPAGQPDDVRQRPQSGHREVPSRSVEPDDGHQDEPHAHDRRDGDQQWAEDIHELMVGPTLGGKVRGGLAHRTGAPR